MMTKKGQSKSRSPKKRIRRRWPEMRWDQAVEKIEKLVFRVKAGNSLGTAFIVSLGSLDRRTYNFATLATAWHVVQGLVGTADNIEFTSSDERIRIAPSGIDCGISPLGPAEYDTGLITLKTDKPLIEVSDLLPMLPYDAMMARGADIGWVGFPPKFSNGLCFFHGHISGYLNSPPTYLVDGVAVGGVSGGPAFDNRAHIIGLVSAYMPNRRDDSTILPGMLKLIPIAAIRYWMEDMLRVRVL